MRHTHDIDRTRQSLNAAARGRRDPPADSEIASVTLIYSGDHSRHAIIRRQIETFLSVGFRVTVIDQPREIPRTDSNAYTHIPIGRSDLGLIVKNLWRVACRVENKRLRAAFWKEVLRARIGVNAIRLAHAALTTPGDLLIAEDLQSTLAALIAKRFNGQPVVYNPHELESEQGDPTESRRTLLRALEHVVVSKVDFLVAPNGSRAALYKQRYSPRAEPIVVENCPPTKTVHRNQMIRKRLDLPESTRIVLYHGALIPYRSLDRLVESASYLEEDIAVVLLGEQGGYCRDVLMPIREARRLEDRVHFLPFVPPDEIPEYIASADLGVVIYENINLNNLLCAPTKLYEYIMMKVPIAVCDFPGLISFLESYPVGIAFKPSDPASIATAINKHFSRGIDEMRRIMRSLENARTRFTWERESRKWLKLLYGLTDQKEAAALVPSEK